MPTSPRLVVLLSGSGRTLQNLIDRIADGQLDASIGGVISNTPNAYGIERAKIAGVPTRIVTREKVSGTYSDAVWDAIRQYKPDFVIMAGWLHLLRIPKDFQLRVLNMHPSLLPAFGGKGMYGHHVHEAVINYGAKISGCTVHFADDTYDTGPILVQHAVPVMPEDTPDTLAARVFAAECAAYPEAIRLVASGGKLVGRMWVSN